MSPQSSFYLKSAHICENDLKSFWIIEGFKDLCLWLKELLDYHIHFIVGGKEALEELIIISSKHVYLIIILSVLEL